ncbi:MAG: transglutaminase family protein [Phycisphaerae bacterium]|nr:transglutaminase family protein [Phycisphaerae bacterium]
MRFRASIWSLVCAALFLCSAAGAEWTQERERWFELTLANDPCGSSQIVTERDGERVRTTSRTTLKLARGGGNDVSVTMESEFIETDKGVPLSAIVRQSTGGTPTEVRYAFDRQGDVWNVEITERGAQRKEQIKSVDWLPPFALELYVTNRLRAGARDISLQSLDLEGGLQLSNVTMKRAGVGQAVIDHQPEVRQISVSLWEVKSDTLPVPSMDRYASDGQLVDSTAKLGIGALRTRLTSKEKALATAQKGGAEVLVKSFVPANRPIKGALESMHLTLRVTAREGDIVDLPSVGAQRTTRIGPGQIEVVIDADRGSPAQPGEAEDPKFLAPSSLVNFDTEDVQALLRRALDGHADAAPRERAELLRRFVGRHITNKNLSSAFASAADAARTASGDCSEHAVLLTAMLRGAKIPARLASGLVYADAFSGKRDVWAWHVWTQALLPGDDGAPPMWLDFDATLRTRFHAAHVCTAVGDLSAGATDPMWSSSLTLMGNIGIEVMEDSTQPARGKQPASAR